MMLVRKARPEDVDIVSRLFRKTIKAVNAEDYDPRQLRVWASKYENFDWWKERVRFDYFLVAEKDNRIIGFCSMNDEGVLGLMYVHKDHQGNGTGNALMKELEKFSLQHHIREIVSEVSITSKHFFEKMGFVFSGKKIKEIEGVKFIDYMMIKKVVHSSHRKEY